MELSKLSCQVEMAINAFKIAQWRLEVGIVPVADMEKLVEDIITTSEALVCGVQPYRDLELYVRH